MKLLATPAFLEEATKHAFNHLPLIGKLLTGEQPTWIVGDAQAKEEAKEDQGRTIRVPAPFKFYIIKDVHDRENGKGTEIVITCLLCDEY